MQLHIADHDIDAGGGLALGRLEHRVGFADAGAGAEEDGQAPALRARLLGLQLCEQLVRIGPAILATKVVHPPALSSIRASGSSAARRQRETQCS